MVVTPEEVKAVIEAAETMADMNNFKNDIALIEQEIDSLDMANILLLLEEKFGVKIPDEDVNALQSVDDIVAYLNKK